MVQNKLSLLPGKLNLKWKSLDLEIMNCNYDCAMEFERLFYDEIINAQNHVHIIFKAFHF